MNDKTLSVIVPLRDDPDPHVFALRVGPRPFDPLVPYSITHDTDADSPQYRPGGQRYKCVQLAIPGGAHSIGALLEFPNVETVDALLYQLGVIRVQLKERFTQADFFEDEDTLDVANALDDQATA